MSMLGQIMQQQVFVQSGWYQRQSGILLPAEVSAILNTYSGTLLIPGASGAARNIFQPGNYVDSTGQTLTATDGAVGLVLDAARSVGPELFFDPECNNSALWYFSTGTWNVSGGLLNATGVPGGAWAGKGSGAVSTGKAYIVECDITAYTQGTFTISCGGVAGPSKTGTGKYRGVYVGTTGTGLQIYASGGTPLIASIDNISVREIPGTHAVQATTQNKPLLRNTGGVQSWQFDGTDDRLTLPTPPLVSTDDFYQAFALRCSTSGANKVFADLLTNPVTGTRLGCLRINSTNFLQVLHVNDAGGTVAPSGLAISDGQLLLVEALRVGTSHTVFADGVTNIQSTLSGNYTTTHATLGARGQGTSELFLGHMHGVFECKGTPTEAERATIRKYLASLQGRSL